MVEKVCLDFQLTGGWIWLPGCKQVTSIVSSQMACRYMHGKPDSGLHLYMGLGRAVSGPTRQAFLRAG